MRKRLLSLLLVFVLVLGMLPASAYAAVDAPFTATTGGAELPVTEKSTLQWADWINGGTTDVTCYTVTVPENTATVTLAFGNENKQLCYYSAAGDYLGNVGGDEMESVTESNVDVDCNNDGTPDGISVQIPGSYSPEYYIQFVYGTVEGGGSDEGGEERNAPFLSIKIDGQDVAAANISKVTDAYLLGDYADDEEQEEPDYYDYVHTVPYYQVTVPCGTTSVDVTYSADADIMNDGTDAYGYTTDLGVDAVSSATVRGTTFKNGYTKNADGTQTVKTPVTGYTNGRAITLEGNASDNPALCLFSFKYEEGTHSFDGATCSVCGGADPDYVAPGVDIPDGTNIKSITAVTSFENGKVISYYQWGSPAGDANSYIATVPEGTETVTVTFKAGTHPDPYTSGAVQKLSGARVYLTVNDMDEEIYNASSKELTAVQTDGLYSVEMNVADFLLSDNSYYGAYDSINAVQYLLAFKYPEGAHVHSYTETVSKQPTCTEKGEKTFTCSCEHSYTEEIAATGHTYGEWKETTPATCAATGEKTRTCTNGCAEGTEGRVQIETIAKLDHEYGDPVEDPKATCTAAGTNTYTCNVCAEGTEGHTKTENVPALGHDYENGVCKNGCGETCPLQDENGAFKIGTYTDLLWFANAVNGGQTTISGVLTADITVEEDWPGIGDYSNKFAGSFDGKNHTVILSGGTWGLFGYTMGTHNNHTLKDAAIIQNVILDGTVQNSALIQNAGYTRISGCINRADITGGNSSVAGIVGTVSGSSKYGQTHSDVLIQNCGNEGNIQGGSKVGGILGSTQAYTRLDGCYNTGAISGSAEVGGLVGYMQGSTGSCSIKNSYNKGAVTGSSYVGGIIGSLYNGAAIVNCYNAGEATYGIAGCVYNAKSSATNTYYLNDLSTYGAPEKNHPTAGGYNTTAHGEAVNSADLNSAEMLTKLGDAFQASCGGPVLTWQTAKEHTISENKMCTECRYGLTEDTILTAHKSTGDGYEIVGDETMPKGSSYTFTVQIEDGYEAPNLAVYYNGTSLTADENGQYTVTPTGHFYITVTGVTALPDAFGIILPKYGDGYRVKACEGYSSPVDSGAEYKFTVEIVEGFKEGEAFEVRVNNAVVHPDANGVYTISDVQEKKTITVHDVVTTSTNKVPIDVSITDGEETFFVAENVNQTIMIDEQVTIPYFDIALYGLQNFYYNPYCYVDEDGNAQNQQKAGTREDANGVVTVLHAFIYLTDYYYLGLGNASGTGYSHEMDSDGDGKSDFQEAMSWDVTGNVGSTFIINFWGNEKGSNLNYHLNYKYPLGREEWGATSDQIQLKDNDVITVHFIDGNANGSAFGFFAANDENNEYNGTEQIDRATVKAGDTIKLTNYIGSQGPNYTTKFVTVGNEQLYWAEKGAETAKIEVADEEEGTERGWHQDGFGNMSADAFKTDANGTVTLDTTGMAPGTYYIATHGEFHAGDGSPDSTGFVSNGAEAGPSYFVLTITEGDAGTQTVYGDVDGDGEITSTDAATVYAIYNEAYTAEITDAMRQAADVDGDDEVTSTDAAYIYNYYNEVIDSFPVEES